MAFIYLWLGHCNDKLEQRWVNFVDVMWIKFVFNILIEQQLTFLVCILVLSSFVLPSYCYENKVWRAEEKDLCKGEILELRLRLSCRIRGKRSWATCRAATILRGGSWGEISLQRRNIRERCQRAEEELSSLRICSYSLRENKKFVLREKWQ